MKNARCLLLGLLLLSACVPAAINPTHALPNPLAASSSTPAAPRQIKPPSLPAKLSVEEYALKGAPQLDPLTFELTQGSVAEVMRKHHVERSVMPRLMANNQLLKPFGFRLTLDTLY